MTQVDEKPVALHPRARLTRAGTSTGGWILEVPAGKRYRVGEDFARIAQRLDGLSTPESIVAARRDGRWVAKDVATVIGILDDWGALGTVDDDTAGRTRRLRRTGALVFQFDLWRPTSVGPFGRAVSRTLWSPAGVTLQILLGLAGLISLVLPGARLDWAARPMDLVELMAVVIVVWSTFAVHELAHAGALIRCGGLPRRFGIMLFYLMPAAYCDVTDAWLLPRRSRALVLLSGILSQFALAGAFLLWGAAGGPAQFTTVVALMLLLTCAVNLVPFVKLDGYLLVAALTETPFLHRRSTEAFTTDVAAVLGGRRPSTEARWVRVFGIFTSLAPIVITVLVLRSMVTAFASWGLFGALLITALVGYLTGLLLTHVGRVVIGAGTGLRARCTVPLVVAVVVAGTWAAATAPVPTRLTAAYVAPADAQPYLVYQENDRCLVPPAGAHVDLATNGLLLRRPVGTGVTEGAVRTVTETPFRMIPVTTAELPTMPMLAQGLDAADIPIPSSGTATVTRGTEPLALHLYRKIWRCGW